MRLILATANPHKVAELRAILAPLGVDPLGLPGGLPEPAETGGTFADNARIKAVTYARVTGHACLADDSGLEIDALGGAPGVISSHYCTDGRETGLSRDERDRQNNERVLRELAGVPDAARTARFVCEMCLADPAGRVLAIARGTFEGRIGRPPRVPAGANGFGYDPLFLVAPAFDRTSAELSPEDKNRLSHRGMASRQLVELLRPLLASL